MSQQNNAALQPWTQGNKVLTKPEMRLTPNALSRAEEIEKSLIYVKSNMEESRQPDPIARCIGPDALKNAPLVAAAPELAEALADAADTFEKLSAAFPEAAIATQNLKAAFGNRARVREWRSLLARANSGWRPQA